MTSSGGVASYSFGSIAYNVTSRPDGRNRHPPLHLCQLPQEIRDMVYFHIFPRTVEIRFRRAGDAWSLAARGRQGFPYHSAQRHPYALDPLSPGVLLVSRQIRRECLKHIYANTTFRIRYQDDFEYLQRNISQLRNTRGMTFLLEITRVEIAYDSYERYSLQTIDETILHVGIIFPAVRFIDLTFPPPLFVGHLLRLGWRFSSDTSSQTRSIQFLSGKKATVRGPFYFDAQSTRFCVEIEASRSSNDE